MQGMGGKSQSNSNTRRRNLRNLRPQIGPRNVETDLNINTDGHQGNAKGREDLGPDSPTTISPLEKGLLRRRSKMLPQAPTLGHSHRLHQRHPKDIRLQDLSPVPWGTREAGCIYLQNLEKGYIHPSKSQYSLLFFFVGKKDGKLCPVVDY